MLPPGRKPACQRKLLKRVLRLAHLSGRVQEALVMKLFCPKRFLTYTIIVIDALNGSSWPKTYRAAQANGGNLLENVL